MFGRIKIRQFEYGLVFYEREFRGLLGPGIHWRFDPLGRETVTVVSQRAPWLEHEQLDLIIRSGVLDDKAVVLELKDFERGLVWIDGRFSALLPPGRYALWTGFRKIRTEVVDARSVRFEHPDREAILQAPCAGQLLEVHDVPADHVAVLFVDGKYQETLAAGRYVFWKDIAVVKLVRVDRRETVLEVPGQEILTADKVSLRLNTVVIYRIADAVRSVTEVDDAKQAFTGRLSLRCAPRWVLARSMLCWPTRNRWPRS